MLLEVCVDDALGLAEAKAGGADRVELCAALGLGGLTPSAGLMAQAAGIGLPCYPMIRPRSGDFVFAAAEVGVMCADIRMARGMGLTGVVLGASRPDGRLDADCLATLITEAAGLDLTLHRAFDLAPDVEEAVETAVQLGFRRILSSGGARVAGQGVARLARIITAAAGRLSIMPGSGITPETWPVLARLAVREVHASCAAPVPVNGQAAEFGFAIGTERRTERGRVAALKTAIGRSNLFHTDSAGVQTAESRGQVVSPHRH
jgi:copper homeostasis protein